MRRAKYILTGSARKITKRPRSDVGASWGFAEASPPHLCLSCLYLNKYVDNGRGNPSCICVETVAARQSFGSDSGCAIVNNNITGHCCAGASK